MRRVYTTGKKYRVKIIINHPPATAIRVTTRRSVHGMTRDRCAWSALNQYMEPASGGGGGVVVGTAAAPCGPVRVRCVVGSGHAVCAPPFSVRPPVVQRKYRLRRFLTVSSHLLPGATATVFKSQTTNDSCSTARRRTPIFLYAFCNLKVLYDY